MRTKNIQDDLEESDRIAVPVSLVRRDELFLRSGDLLISSANSWDLVGKTCYVASLRYRATAGGFIGILRNKPAVVDSRYLFHWMRTPRTMEAVRNCGRQTTNISNLSVERFLDLSIPLPPLHEQRYIATVLDKADAIRRKRRDLLKELWNLEQALVGEALSSPDSVAATIQSLLDDGSLALHKDGNHGSNYPRAGDFVNQANDGIPFLTAKDLEDDRGLRVDKLVYLSKEKAAQLTIGWIEEGDVLLAHNATVGPVAIYDGEMGRALIGTSLTCFRANPGRLSPVAIYAALKDPRFQAQLRKQMKQTTRNQVPIASQRNLVVRIASRVVLERLREQMVVFDRLYRTLMAAVEQDQVLLHSLGAKAFRGELAAA
jgi:type I restriction enzyme S subunit